MVAIAPFRALRFDPDRVDLTTVTSPPHDVISEEEQHMYRARDPHSIVHVIQPEARDGDAVFPDSPNKYERAADVIAAWQADGTLVRDGPAFYLYEVRHPDRDGNPVVMRGFFARLALDPTYTDIRRHERTLPGKKKDRLHLQTATGCNTESIWMLYRDERGWVDEILVSNADDAVVDFEDGSGARHRLSRVDRPEAVDEIVAQFEDRFVVIADGHHRYQTALDRWAESGRDEDGSILVCMVRDTDPGLRIEPTHRLIHDIPVPIEDAMQAAEAVWDVSGWDLPADVGQAAKDVRAWVDASDRRCVVLAGDKAWRLELRPGSDVDEGRGRLDSLVVTRVHERLLADWGVTADNVEGRVGYTRSDDEAVRIARAGEAAAVVMLSGEEVDAVLDVAGQGHVMPQKSTYFVPKLRSGVVMGPLDEPRPVPWTTGEGGAASFKVPRLD